jgi:hypothetical protein
MYYRISDDEIQRAISENLQRPNAKGVTPLARWSEGGFLSLSDMFGLESDNRFLNWRGVVPELAERMRGRHKLEVDPEALARQQRHHEFNKNMFSLIMMGSSVLCSAVDEFAKRQGQG